MYILACTHGLPGTIDHASTCVEAQRNDQTTVETINSQGDPSDYLAGSSSTTKTWGMPPQKNTSIELNEIIFLQGGVICLLLALVIDFAIDHASLSRRSTFSLLLKETTLTNLWALVTVFPYVTK